ncbi:MAG: GntR family transcriptional regulator [Alphaproteobacteria bacterium]|nr:GntR family transcriptional regulator [Alphaproteobacteria bacterium]MBU1516534.1 GntR family transcriptional regulator [Alphaproteobacteria bacterium]MBU2094291.1 GntR family transcriptional regulator [Alphaproteobacteria bacterium]MBU2154132.1 GntR family transcriptional regulator [Alphaproteobacteria bacterium]MBU2307461.1 GntR family transcriptional regulator [Alphaproteobacteria bacterium]
MADTLAEPFHVAFLRLRERLQDGAFPPGARITAVDVADELRLSTTPVREALSRLAGQGLLEDRRGQGYFVARLSAADVADLYRLSLAALLIAQEPHRTTRRPPAGPGDSEAPLVTVGAVRDVEILFRDWAVETGSRALTSSFRTLQIQLGPVRRLEPLVFDDLDEEAERLDRASARNERLAQLRQFHGRRIRLAERLAGLLDASAAPPKK